MQLAWLTDIHLNFIDADARKKFYQEIINTEGVLISASLDEINFLNTVFGNEKVTANQIDEIKKLIKKYTIQEKINKEIEEIMEKAWNLFEKLDVDNSYTDVLKDLMEFNLKRSY